MKVNIIRLYSVYLKDKLCRILKLSFCVLLPGPKTWSCAKCLYPYGDPHELMNHIPSCPKLQSNSETKASETPTNASGVFYKCNLCPLTFSSEEEIKVNF